MIPGYDPGVCDLCGATAHHTLLDKALSRSMTSDGRIVAELLRKQECARCGLVRHGHPAASQVLTTHYQADYTLNISGEQEHHFYTSAGPKPRSAVFAEWMWSLLPATVVDVPTVLEVGCSAGHLLARVQEKLPAARCFGTEMSAQAVLQAQENGLSVVQGGIEAAPDHRYDLIYCIGVLEHVPSPRAFLGGLRERLSPEGTLLLCQPTQDVPGYDVYFADHLSHFGSDHLRMYAHQAGFREQAMMAGHPLMPNFSMHVWRLDEAREAPPIWDGRTRCREAIDHYEAYFRRVDALVDAVAADPGRRLAVFGLNEVFALLMAYTGLGETEIVCGLSDVEPPRPVDFPVVKPEEAVEHGITDVLLCINTIYLDRVRARLIPLGMAVHAGEA